MAQPATIDWDLLHAKATEAMLAAYAPYSKFPVGVAGLVYEVRAHRRHHDTVSG